MDIIDIELLLSKSALHVFGSEKALQDKKYKELAQLCHPDLGGSKELFQLLEKKWAELAKPKTRITSKKGVYELDEQIYSGDLADFWLSSNRLLKVARLPHNLSNETTVYKELAKDTKFPKLAPYYFSLLDSFSLPDGRNVNVFPYEDEWVSLEKVGESYKNALDFRNASWIIKRVLAGIGLLHELGFVHGAILPSHILVNPKTHGAKIIGLNHSCKIGQNIKTISPKYKSLYAPEILAKENTDPSTDIYMIAETILSLVENSISNYKESKLLVFLNSLLVKQSKRLDNAWLVHEYFDELLDKVYGQKKWVELKV